MPAQILQGFNVNASEPIDSKYTVATEADRNALPGVYEGLIVYVESDNKVWVCTNATAPTVDSSWTELATDSGTTQTIVVDTVLTDGGLNPVQGGAIKTYVDTVATGDANVQADWAEADPTDDSYIENKPSTISAQQAQDIVTNNAKEGVTPGLRNEITANTNKVGITPTQAADITANNSKVGITSAQSDAILANSLKVGITDEQAEDIVENTAKIGITSAQSDAILANTAKPTETEVDALIDAIRTSNDLLTFPNGATFTGGGGGGFDINATDGTGGSIDITETNTDTNPLATTAYVDNNVGTAGDIDVLNQTNDKELWEGTLAQYNAITSKSNDIYYFITDDFVGTTGTTGGGTTGTGVVNVSGGAQAIPDQSIAWVSATMQYVNDTGAEVAGVDNTFDFTQTGWLRLGDGDTTITNVSELPQSGATDKQVLTWNNTDSEWEAADAAVDGGASIIDVSTTAGAIPDGDIAWVSNTMQYVNDTGAEVNNVSSSFDFTATGWLRLGDGNLDPSGLITEAEADVRYLQQSLNLSDVNDADTAITNLGLTKGSGNIITDLERSNIGAVNINGLTVENNVVAGDEFIFYDVSEGENRKISLAELQALTGWTGGTTPVDTGLTSISLDSLTFTGAGATANITVSGEVGTNFNLSVVTTTPVGWLTAGALGATAGTIPASGMFTTTIVIPVVTTTVTRTAAIRAINTADATDIVTTGLFTQSHTAPVSNGNLVVDGSLSIVGTTATFSVDITAGDPNFTAILYDGDPATTGAALETMTATALGVITFTDIDTTALTAGAYSYYIQVSDNDGDVITEAEAFTIADVTSTGASYGWTTFYRASNVSSIGFPVHHPTATSISVNWDTDDEPLETYTDSANTFTIRQPSQQMIISGAITLATTSVDWSVTDTSVSPNVVLESGTMSVLGTSATTIDDLEVHLVYPNVGFGEFRLYRNERASASDRIITSWGVQYASGHTSDFTGATEIVAVSGGSATVVNPGGALAGGDYTMRAFIEVGADRRTFDPIEFTIT